MVFTATFINISVISWLYSVSFIGGGNRSTRRKPPTCRKSVTNLINIILYRVHLACAGFELTTLVLICTDCIGSCKSNYHTITTTTTTGLNRSYQKRRLICYEIIMTYWCGNTYSVVAHFVYFLIVLIVSLRFFDVILELF